MKYLKFGTAILAAWLFSCNHNTEHKNSVKNTVVKADTFKTLNPSGISVDKQEPKDKEEIQNLIRKVLNWKESKNSIDLLPALANSKDSIYTGFDREKLNANLEKLKSTRFFSSGFIDNYNQIILALDKGLKNKEFGAWHVGDLPTFSFANDVDPWCLCQDVPYDKPNPWDLVEVEVINLNNEKGKLYWKWGNTELNKAPGWKEFTYKFDVVKENGEWKIAYLQGFDFKASTRTDGSPKI